LALLQEFIMMHGHLNVITALYNAVMSLPPQIMCCEFLLSASASPCHN